MSSFHRMFAAAALLVGASGAAHALELFTPASQAQQGSFLECRIVNVGTRPIEVSARLQNFPDGSDMAGGGLCPVPPATLAPGAGCSVANGGLGTRRGYCHFTTTSSKVRADLLVYDINTGEVTSTLSATK